MGHGNPHLGGSGRSFIRLAIFTRGIPPADSIGPDLVVDEAVVVGVVDTVEDIFSEDFF